MQRDDPSFCNNAAMREATRRLGQLYDEFLRPSGLRTTQYTILVRVDRAPGSTMNELSRHLVMDQSALGHTLKPLIRDGFIDLVTHEQDRRAKIVRLTRVGKAKLGEAQRLWRKAQTTFEQVYGTANAAKLREAMAFLTSEDFHSTFRAAAAS